MLIIGALLKVLGLHEGGDLILGFLPLFIENPICIERLNESNRMYPFLVAKSHSIRGFVHRLVRRSVGPSVPLVQK